MFFESEAESAPRKAHQLNGWIVKFRLPSPVLNGYPNPVGDLSGEIVELEG